MSQSAAIARAYKMREKLKTDGTVPLESLAVLDERLFLSFGPRLHRSTSNDASQETQKYRPRWRLKHAQSVFNRVRVKDPHIFLPFVLTTSPRGCEKFDDAQFEQNHRVRLTIPLNKGCQELLKTRAKKLGIEENIDFQNYLFCIFGLDSPPRAPPLTDAEGKNHCAYHLAHVQSIRNVFSDYIQKAVCSSLTQLNEMANCHPPETTESVWMKLPKQTMQDAVLHLDIGSADELARLLFPHTSPSIFSFLWPQTSNIVLNHNVELSETSHNLPSPDLLGHCWDSAYCTLRGASLSAIKSIFTPYVYAAIESSELRRWEADLSFLETTDCVTLNVWRSRPHFGFIRLRIGYSWSASFLNDLYAANA